jgi:hypothetical protein
MSNIINLDFKTGQKVHKCAGKDAVVLDEYFDRIRGAINKKTSLQRVLEERAVGSSGEVFNEV